MTDPLRPQIFGILNLTPDSFSDGGAFDTVDAAMQHARRMFDHGADAIDVGGESTRPGAQRIDAAEQLRRVLPVIAELVGQFGRDRPISIDTTRAEVAAAALNAGASIINDVSAGRDDEAMLPLAADRRVPIILMHMRGEPATMQRNPTYDDVIMEVTDFLLQRAEAAKDAGVDPSRIILDPGIGFGKTIEHNLRLLAGLPALVDSGYPIMLGTSRKRFLGEIIGESEADKRDVATAATTALGVVAGVRLFRVHDVKPNRHAADVAWRIRGAS